MQKTGHSTILVEDDWVRVTTKRALLEWHLVATRLHLERVEKEHNRLMREAKVEKFASETSEHFILRCM